MGQGMSMVQLKIDQLRDSAVFNFDFLFCGLQSCFRLRNIFPFFFPVIVEASQPTSGGLANVVKLVVGTPSWRPKQTAEIAGLHRGYAVQVLRECASGACCSFKQFAA